MKVGPTCTSVPTLAGRAGQLPAPGRASERDRGQGFGAHNRAGLRHATGGRASERDQASAHTTGPGFGTPLAKLIPVDGSDFVVVFLDFSNYHPVKVAKCLVTSSS